MRTRLTRPPGMERGCARVCAAALLLCLAFVALAPSAARAETPAATQQVAAGGPSLVTRAGQAFVKLQRDVNRAITRQLVAIRRGEEPLALWLGLGIAFLYGVAHAPGPGHGKAVVASYFLSREASVLRGAVMGGQIALALLAVLREGRVVAAGPPDQVLTEALIRDVFEVRAHVERSPHHGRRHIHFLVD